MLVFIRNGNMPGQQIYFFANLQLICRFVALSLNCNKTVIKLSFNFHILAQTFLITTKSKI